VACRWIDFRDTSQIESLRGGTRDQDHQAGRCQLVS